VSRKSKLEIKTDLKNSTQVLRFHPLTKVSFFATVTGKGGIDIGSFNRLRRGGFSLPLEGD
jgi:hypothetical protein